MAEIIEFGQKVKSLRSIRDTGLRQRKIEALRQVFQCTRCMLKCAKCGIQLDKEGDESVRYAGPYTFCRNCSEEYEEYKERSEGKQVPPKYYWHNEQWMKVWDGWLEHQSSLDQYRQSKEFLQLIREVEELLS
ncbi:MAG: hypothetical protein AB2L11_03775 [Syntrophobacteraceae bacterium]